MASGYLTTRRGALLGSLSLAGAAALPGVALAAPPPDLDALVRATMDAFDVPGLSIAIVEDGRTVACRGYGVRRLDSPQAVDEATVFNIASCAKAFTAAALAMLVDEGKLAWDDPVTDRLPGFRMWDPYVTRELTVRDLLVHNSGLGLGAGDLLFWPNTDYSRPEIVQRLRAIRPATSFRAGFAYDNILYIVAHEVIAAVSGMAYERFIAERLLRPAGMANAYPSNSFIPAQANQAWPHGRTGGPVRGLGEMAPIAHRPGIDDRSLTGIACSARDMSAWLTVQLARGALPGGGRLFSEVQSKEMWTGRTIVSANGEPRPSPQSPGFVIYALGWFLQDYRGHPHIWHTGGTTGMSSLVVLLPERRAGFAVLLNSEDGMVLRTMKNSLLDHYLGLSRTDWLASSRAFDEAQTKVLAERGAVVVARPADARPPSLPLAAYAGTYRDAWYGDVVITAGGEGLAIDFTRSPTMKGGLDPWTRDTFRTRFADPNVEAAFVTFNLNPDGSVDQIKLQAVSPEADFSYDYQDLVLRPIR